MSDVYEQPREVDLAAEVGGEVRGGRVGRLVVLAAIVGAALFLGLSPTEAWIAWATAPMGEAGAVGAVAFVALFVVATVVVVPNSLLAMAAGALFGFAGGTLLVWAASVVGAMAATSVGRYLVRDFVQARVARRPRLLALLSAVEAESFKVILLARLIPIIPTNLLNYALGLTAVRWRPYVAASVVGMLPGIIAFVYLGAVAGSLTRAVASANELDAMGWVLRIVGALLIGGGAWWLTRRARRELDQIIARSS